MNAGLAAPRVDGHRQRPGSSAGATSYRIHVHNPAAVSRGVAMVELDGTPLPSATLPLLDDGSVHDVTVRLGEAGRTARSAGSRRTSRNNSDSVPAAPAGS